jgi:predicted TIM-barrel fold metal-dependent hydrolase
MPLFDAHAHLPLDTPDSHAFFVQRDMRVLNICVASNELGGLDAQRRWYRELHAIDPDRFPWVTSFSLEGFGQPGWADRCLEQIDADLAAGAVGCKVWKNVGMELRDPQTGGFVFVDDARFEPIFAHLERVGVPLLAHIAEPIAAWRPLDPGDPHYGYFSVAKQWHWHGRTDVPNHERLIASRDAVVERHPGLTFVALHLGSQEHDLPAVAERLRRWPNYVVDTAARLGDLVRNASRDREAVRAFFAEFADRIIWGVDWVLTAPVSTRTPEKQQLLLETFAKRYELERRYFATDEEVTVGPNSCRGLKLDAGSLEKLMSGNAERVYARQTRA